jgi:hypothetical protein
MASATPSSEQHTQPNAAVCAECGVPLTGLFCSQCGEHAMDRHSLTLSHFLQHNLLHELSHVDGKIFSTFRYLLFRPGFLTVEYFAGRRLRYINPVRLLLTCLVILALLPAPGSMIMSIGKVRLNLLPPGPPSAETIKATVDKLDMFGILGGLMAHEAQHKDLQAKASVEKFNHELKTYVTALSFSIVVLMAIFLVLLYHRRRPLFVEHLVFSLHLASFVVLFSAVPGPVFGGLVTLFHGRGLNMIAGALAFALIATQVIYLYKAMLRFYWTDTKAKAHWWSMPRWTTTLSVLAIFVANSGFITITYAAGAAIALWRL